MQNLEWYLADLKSTEKNTIETIEKSLTDMFIRLVRIYPCLHVVVYPEADTSNATPTPIPTIWNIKALSYTKRIMINVRIKLFYLYYCHFRSCINHVSQNCFWLFRLWIQYSKLASGFLSSYFSHPIKKKVG